MSTFPRQIDLMKKSARHFSFEAWESCFHVILKILKIKYKIGEEKSISDRKFANLTGVHTSICVAAAYTCVIDTYYLHMWTKWGKNNLFFSEYRGNCPPNAITQRFFARNAEKSSRQFIMGRVGSPQMKKVATLKLNPSSISPSIVSTINWAVNTRYRISGLDAPNITISINSSQSWYPR